jgi:4-hydroxy-2-oxoheptanedioate aldolase
MILAERLAGGAPVLTAWSSIASTNVVDLLALSPFEAVTLDMQHGAHDEKSVYDGIHPIVLRGKGAIVRIPVGRFDMASRALDFGAEAVIAPMINSRRDAEAFAASMKYPPAGERSWGPHRAMQLHGSTDAQSYMNSADTATLAFAMIETRAAFAALDEILGVPGIDGVFVGPSDFSISWTDGTKLDPTLSDMQDAVGEIAMRARAKGKHAGVFAADPADAGRYADMGFGLIAIINDVAYLRTGIDALLNAAKR